MLINTSSDLKFFGTRIGASQDARVAEKLVAVTGADGDLVTALRAAAAENGGASLGLHAAKKAVRLGAAAAVGLKGTLRHGTELLKRAGDTPAGSFRLLQQLLIVPYRTGFSQGSWCPTFRSTIKGLFLH